MGINTQYKVIAFAIGVFCRYSWCPLFFLLLFLRPEIFGFLKSIDILIIVVLGVW